jgi:hypothetical protein
MATDELQSKRSGRIIHLRRSLTIIMTEELDDFDMYDLVTVSKVKGKKRIIIEQE